MKIKRIGAMGLTVLVAAVILAVPTGAANWGRWMLSYSNKYTPVGEKDNNNNSEVYYSNGDLVKIRAATYGVNMFNQKKNCTANSEMYVVLSPGESRSIPTNVKTKGYTKACIAFSSDASGVSGNAEGTYSLG